MGSCLNSKKLVIVEEGRQKAHPISTQCILKGLETGKHSAVTGDLWKLGKKGTRNSLFSQKKNRRRKQNIDVMSHLSQAAQWEKSVQRCQSSLGSEGASGFWGLEVFGKTDMSCSQLYLSFSLSSSYRCARGMESGQQCLLAGVS